MALNKQEANPAKKFVKAFDLSQVLPQDHANKKYHILLGGSEMKTVQDAVNKINDLFNIQNIVLTSGDAAVPYLENIQILEFLDDVKVQRKSGTKTPPIPRKSNPTAHNNVAYFLNMVRAEATASEMSETSTREVSDAPTKDNSSSSEAPDQADFSEFITPPPKRRRVRKHKKKSQQAVDHQNGNGTDEQIPEIQEPEPEDSALQALYSLKETYKTAPIFKRTE